MENFFLQKSAIFVLLQSLTFSVKSGFEEAK